MGRNCVLFAFCWVALWHTGLAAANVRDNASENTGTWRVRLADGWNLVSVPVTPDAADQAGVLAAFPFPNSLWQWDAANQCYHKLTVIAAKKAFWAYSNTPVELAVTGALPDDRQLSLDLHWNLVGPLAFIPPPAADGVVLPVWQWDDETERYRPAVEMTLGLGYWVFCSDVPCTIDLGDPAADTDGDGLSDLRELVAGTDRLKTDTDGDGFGDGVEVAAGSDPTSAESVPAMRTLAVAGGVGGVTPDLGIHAMPNNSVVECQAPGTVSVESGVRRVCTGWRGAGSVPAQGATDDTGSFHITLDSSISWQWKTQYRLDATTAGDGSVVAARSSPWFDSGATATLTADPAAGNHFVRWTGDVPAGAARLNPLTLRMNRPRTLSAEFAPDDWHVAVATVGDGAVSPSGTVPAADGETLVFQVVPADGKRLSDVKLDGASLGVLRTIQVADIHADHTLVAEFADPGPLPPDPATIAPAPPRGVVPTPREQLAFLYTGPDPVQYDAQADAFDPKRIGAVHGRVLDGAGAPLSGVKVAVAGHPEQGWTLTREDGTFDLAVNGADRVRLSFSKAGFLPAFRPVHLDAWERAVLDDVVLKAPSTVAVPVQFGAAAPARVATGESVTDADGARTPRLFVPAGTLAQARQADGAFVPVSDLTLRFTEYTVGDSGPKAMPAELPPGIGYTYCIEIGADEAAAGGDGVSVKFDQLVPFYVENFLGIPVGTDVPVGYYDADKGAWVPAPNGRVLALLGPDAQGRMDIDTDGDGQADDAAVLDALGISDSERLRLAQTYTPPVQLWRVPLEHLSPVDLNYPVAPNGAAPLNPPEPTVKGRVAPHPTPTPNKYGYIETETQVFRESLPVVGTPLTLNYTSAFAPGRTAENTVDIPLINGDVPADLKKVVLDISIRGQLFRCEFDPAPDLSYTFTWDGKDRWGRPLAGPAIASIHIGYVYPGVYGYPPQQNPRGFGLVAGAPLPGPIYTRRDITLWQDPRTVALAAPHAKRIGIGGWMLSAHHTYAPETRTLYLGTGDIRRADALPNHRVIRTVAGTGTAGDSGDGGPSTAALLDTPLDVAVAPDGTLYIADSGNNRIRRVARDGTISTFAGTGAAGFSGDDGPATAAQLNHPTAVALGSDGSVYLSDTGNNRIRRVATDGTITTVCGGGANTGDGPAPDAALDTPRGIAVGLDGSLFIAEYGANRVRRIGPDGWLATVAGNGGDTAEGDDGPAIEAGVPHPTDVAVAPDGGLLIVDPGWISFFLRRVAPDGVIGLAYMSGIQIHGVAPGPEGTFYFSDEDNLVYRGWPDSSAIRSAGRADLWQGEYSGDGGPATAAGLNSPAGLAVGPDGAIYVADSANHAVRRIGSRFPGFTGGELLIPSEDGAVAYVFDASGRHLRTLDALTGNTLLEFGYTADGRLESVTDRDGRVTHIEYDLAGNPVAIVAPGGQTTLLECNEDGWLARVANPAAETVQLEYGAGGLLTAVVSRRNHRFEVQYDALGLAVHASDPAGGSDTFTRQSSHDSITVTDQTAEGRSTTVSQETNRDGTVTRTFTSPGNLAVQRVEQADGTTTVDLPDGTSIASKLGPDPRFGMLSPVSVETTVTLPSWTTLHSQFSRSVQLADPFSLESMTDTSVINGRTATAVYTAVDRTLRVTTPAGRTAAIVYDAKGRPVRVQVPGTASTEFQYDARGRFIAVTRQSGRELRATTFTYRDNDALAELTDPLERVSAFDADPVGRLLHAMGPGGQQLLMNYDRSDSPGSIVLPNGHTHTFPKNSVGLPASWNLPDTPDSQNAAFSYAYDKDRLPTTVTRPDGASLSFSYDAAGRVTALHGADDTLNLVYDNAGRVASIADAPPDQGAAPYFSGGSVAFAYDGPLLTAVTSTGGLEANVTFEYNADFALAAVHDAAHGADLALEYDADGLLTSIDDFHIDRDADNGHPTAVHVGNIAEQLAYNDFGETASYTAAAGQTTLYSVTYTRDKLGRITAKTETIASQTVTTAYTYDPDGRLCEVRKNGVLTEAYTYDPDGNRLTAFRAGAGTVDAEYDARDRLVQYGDATFAYSPAGNLESRTVNGQTTEYEYDARGNLRRVTLPDGTVIEYIVDPLGRRVGKVVNGVRTRTWVYGADSLHPWLELDPQTDAVVAEFAGPVMVKNGRTYRLIRDQVGSVRLVVDVETGEIVQQIEYDSFGRVLSDTNPGFQPFGFGGGLYDPDTGLVRFGLRDYDPETGRWTNLDPIGFTAGLNLYAYCRNDPVNLADPWGMLWGELDMYGAMQEMGTAGFEKGGLGGWVQGNFYSGATALLDLLGGKSVQRTSGLSGSAAGAGDTVGAVRWGGETVGRMAAAAAGGVAAADIAGTGLLKVHGAMTGWMAGESVPVVDAAFTYTVGVGYLAGSLGLQGYRAVLAHPDWIAAGADITLGALSQEGPPVSALAKRWWPAPAGYALNIVVRRVSQNSFSPSK